MMTYNSSKISTLETHMLCEIIKQASSGYVHQELKSFTISFEKWTGVSADAKFRFPQVFVADGESTLVEGCGLVITCTQRSCVARNLGCVNPLFLS